MSVGVTLSLARVRTQALRAGIGSGWGFGGASVRSGAAARRAARTQARMHTT